ncbi:MAG TPA: hypothetical protein VFM94_10670 [Solirubrobacterales bacterium]|nr:hypothetical protein [Solirubrobacterales bacterium]
MPQQRLNRDTGRSALNRVSLRIDVIVAIAALSALFLLMTGAATAAQPYGKDGVIHACFKAKGKNKGALRVVPAARGCKRLRGWRPIAWSANGSSGALGQNGSQGAGGGRGEQGEAGPEGKQGLQGLAGQVEESLVETVKTQSAEIKALTDQLTTLEGTVEGACAQLTALTDQTNDIVTGVTSLDLNNALELIGAVIAFPNLPATLETFECE